MRPKALDRISVSCHFYWLAITVSERFSSVLGYQLKRIHSQVEGGHSCCQHCKTDCGFQLCLERRRKAFLRPCRTTRGPASSSECGHMTCLTSSWSLLQWWPQQVVQLQSKAGFKADCVIRWYVCSSDFRELQFNLIFIIVSPIYNNK